MRPRTSTSSLGRAIPDVAFPHEAVLSAPSASRVAGLLALDLNLEPDLSLNLRPNVEDRATGSESAQSLASSTQAAGICARRSARHSALVSLAIFAFLVAALLHAGFRSGSLAAPASVPPGHFEATFEESAMRKNPKSFAVAAAAALSVGAGAAAVPSTGDAVQWRVEDGGNGHWYAVLDAATGDDALLLAISVGGHLATITGAGENDVIKSLFLSTGKNWAWLGLRQLENQLEPSNGWRWITGEPLEYVNWTNHDGGLPTGAPDDSPCALPPWGVENNQANQGVMDQSGRWDDLETGLPTCGSPAWDNTAVIEWSADCNGDGIVDFGQIRAGELEDTNANNIPDCCENGNPCACDADVTGNGNVDAADLAAVLSAWGGAPTGKANADVNGDGNVDAADLAAVLSSWGPCP